MTVIYDGSCGFCRQCILWLRKQRFRSDVEMVSSADLSGKRLLDVYGLHEVCKSTIVVIINDVIYTKSEALLEIFRKMRGFGIVFSMMKLTPRTLRDAVYNCIARNRNTCLGGECKH
jgi:predicted DCC family thiol-disulfide oxidoreductase YuxK